MFQTKKGFTLLELLIVIAILAILASVTFVALNPAELLKKSRDSQRLADLASVKTAINYYIANTTTPILGDDSAGVGCVDNSTDYTYSAVSGVAYTNTTNKGNTSQQIGSSGWITVRLDHLTGGSPLAKWPIDPNPTTSSATPGRYYAYLCNYTNTTFSLFANMESTTYANGGNGDVESKDGGNIAGIYEVGSAFLASTTTTNFYNGGS
ncbi:MAG: type II secretion system protein [Patescibacteria group bacterium]